VQGPSPNFMVEVRAATKHFGRVAAVNHVSFAVSRGAFCSLLGPSGCGKTTTLRMIAGFERPDAGEILIDGTSCSGLPPYRRNTAMVFQGFALFPHRTVLQNVAFGLRMRKMGTRPEIASMAREALSMVGLEGLEGRFPRQLSGGQQQRVALARALVLRPAVLLLDEPFASLDLKLRKRMRYELKALQQRVGVTALYVTHDQEEALSMSDSIVVMNAGVVEQIGSPQEVYFSPRSSFVADFVGESNTFDGRITAVRDGRVVVGGTGLPGDLVAAAARPASGYRVGDTVRAFVRAESVRVAAEAPGAENWFAGEVVARSFLGAYCRIHLRTAALQMPIIADIETADARGLATLDTVAFGWPVEDTILLVSGDGR
jgi:spermidine/putrescine transport system ATP-binding protein